MSRRSGPRREADRPTRRTLLATLAGAGVASVAGCLGSDDGGDDPDGTADDGAGADAENSNDGNGDDDSDDGTEPAADDGRESSDPGACAEWAPLAAHEVADTPWPLAFDAPESWDVYGETLQEESCTVSIGDPGTQEPSGLYLNSLVVSAMIGDRPYDEIYTSDRYERFEATDPIEIDGETVDVLVGTGGNTYTEDGGTVEWLYATPGPNGTHVLGQVTVYYAPADCEADLREFGRTVVESLALNDESTL